MFHRYFYIGGFLFPLMRLFAIYGGVYPRVMSVMDFTHPTELGVDSGKGAPLLCA